MAEESKKRRISIEVDQDLHREIKMFSALRNMTLKPITDDELMEGCLVMEDSGHGRWIRFPGTYRNLSAAGFPDFGIL